MFLFVIFFFQAEDGIRDGHVTGVQTCALPICDRRERDSGDRRGARVPPSPHVGVAYPNLGRPPRAVDLGMVRSEERRVGKECRYRRCACEETEKRIMKESKKKKVNRREKQIRG